MVGVARHFFHGGGHLVDGGSGHLDLAVLPVDALRGLLGDRMHFLGGGGQAYYNLTAAAALIAALPPLVLALTIQRYLVRGLSFGAVKA